MFVVMAGSIIKEACHPTSMKYIIKTSRVFYGIAILVYGIQQFIYGNFRPVQLPPWQFHLPALNFIAYVTGAGLIVAGASIIFHVRARNVSLVLAGIFLLLVCLVHIPYELISEPNKSYHLGLWESTLKELALAGGAFVVAGSYTEIPMTQKSVLIKSLEKLIPFGSLFFSVTIVSFGIAHFMYEKFIEPMVPSWIPDHTFWTYFSGTALIGAGVCIILDISKQKIAALLGTMLFLWFWMVHIPGAMANPWVDRGNLVSSAFDALAFSGTAFLIAAGKRLVTKESLTRTSKAPTILSLNEN